MSLKEQESVLNWLSITSKDERVLFLKSAICLLRASEEVNAIESMASNEKKRMEDLAARVVSVPAKAVSVPIPLAERITLWSKVYDKRKIVAIDCEFVTIDGEIPGTFRQKVATVGIVDFYGTEIYRAQVQYKRGDFKTNQHTRKVNGFNQNSLLVGKAFEEVQRKVRDIMEDNLIIMCGATQDFKALELPLLQTEVDLFDLQKYYCVKKYDSNYPEVCGLGRIYYNLFGSYPQFGRHDSLKDAETTIEIFREKYINEFHCKCNRDSFWEGFDYEDMPQLSLEFNLNKQFNNEYKKRKRRRTKNY